MNDQRVYTWEELAAYPNLWVAFLWRAMTLSGKGYRQYSLGHTGKGKDRREDKIEGPLAGAPKWFRSYATRYATPPITSRTPRQLRRARAAAAAIGTKLKQEAT